MNIKKFLIGINEPARKALRLIDQIAKPEATVFVVKDNKIAGSITDGDIRRGLLKDCSIDDPVTKYMNPEFSFLTKGYSKKEINTLKGKGIRFVPLLNENHNIEDVIDTFVLKANLPLDAVIMAGGEGRRLKPLTDNTPKPLIKVGEKPIIEYNIDRLRKYGIKNINITLRHLGEQVEAYFGNGSKKNLNINYVYENEPLGTFGAVGLIKEFHNDDLLIMNSDLLTDIDYEDFFTEFKNSGADMMVASTPYRVNVPYAVMELNGSNEVLAFKEKPKYTYYSNAGIYLIKKELLNWIPPHKKFDATDLIQMVIDKKRKLITEPILGYWLDIGKMEDLAKAQQDIKHLNL